MLRFAHMFLRCSQTDNTCTRLILNRIPFSSPCSFQRAARHVLLTDCNCHVKSSVCHNASFGLKSPVIRNFSSEPDENKQKELDDRKSSLFQRFKEAYAIYGKVVIVIHGITSCLWFGGAYLTALSGLNLLQLLEAANVPDWMCRPLRLAGGSVNQWATALVLYKILAPFRYGLTVVLSRYAVRYLRATGKAPAVTDQTRLRTLAKESAQLSRDRLRVRLSNERARAKRSFFRYRR